MGDWSIKEQQYQCDSCGFVLPQSRMRRQLSQTVSGGFSGRVVCDKCWDPFFEPLLIGTTEPREKYDYENVRPSNITDAAAVSVPVLSSISPSATTAAAFLASPTVTCTGTGFTTQSRVQFRYLESFMPTTYVSPTSITATVYAGLIAVGSHSVRVVNIGPPYRSTTLQPNGVGDNASATLAMVLS